MTDLAFVSGTSGGGGGVGGGGGSCLTGFPLCFATGGNFSGLRLRLRLRVRSRQEEDDIFASMKNHALEPDVL